MMSRVFAGLVASGIGMGAFGMLPVLRTHWAVPVGHQVRVS